MAATLPKSERLCGKTAIAGLVDRGRGGTAGCLRYKFLVRADGDPVSRILLSVPKRSFKRAVKRNLLKRRMREAYRQNKELTGPGGRDILFVYNHPEIASYAEISDEICSLLRTLPGRK